MAQPLLHEGEYVEEDIHVTDNFVADQLRSDVKRLERELYQANAEIASLRRENNSKIAHLRHTLTPLYQSLQRVFGEMDAIGDTDAPDAAAPDSVNPHQRAIWDSWKRKLGGKAADAIEALLLHGEMNSQAIAIAIGMHRNNVPKIMFKLNQAGILRKNGNNYALKTN